jgi:hypothetical protein
VQALTRRNEAGTEEIEVAAAIHLPPHEFELGDLALRLAFDQGCVRAAATAA